MSIGAFEAVANDVAQAVGSAIEPYREPLGIDEFKITPAEDHDGDPVLYVRFKHHLVKPRLRSDLLRTMHSTLRRAARDKGEQRFVHTRHDFDDRQLLDTDK